MKLSPELHPALDKRSVALLAQYNVRSLAQLLATRPEKLASMLAISYTAAAELRRQLFQQFSSFPSLGLEDYQARLEREVTVSTGSTQLDTVLELDTKAVSIIVCRVLCRRPRVMLGPGSAAEDISVMRWCHSSF